MCAQLLTTPLPEVLQKDGSIAAFQQLLQDIANPTALAEFDPEIFKAALTGAPLPLILANHLLPSSLNCFLVKYALHSRVPEDISYIVRSSSSALLCSLTQLPHIHHRGFNIM